MVLKGFTRRIKPLEILTDEQIEAIHRGTLDVLQEAGVTFDHEGALKLFEENGCQVDFKKKRVRISDYLVEECLRKCPSSFTFKARDPKDSVRVGGNTSYFSLSPGMDTVDLDTWERGTPTLQDEIDAVKVLDALDNLHMLAYGPYHHFEDVPPIMTALLQVACMIRYSTKVGHSGSFKGSEVWAIKMAKATEQQIRGGVMASPPLTYSRGAIDAAFHFAEVGFPIGMLSGAVYGGTAPATLAGAMITNNAELMAGIVLIQLIKPGLGVVAENYTHPMDMSTGSIIFGAVESGLHDVMFNQIWRRYRIPSMSIIFSAGKAIDYQSGYEKTTHALLTALSGCNIIDLHGGMFAELTYHSAMAVLDDDIAGMIGRVLEGVEVTDETLAINLIEEVGPIPGYYLDKEHTRKYWRKEQFIPKAADRLEYPVWKEKGRKVALEYAKERIKEILATHEPKPLTKDQDKEIDTILEEAKKHYKEKGLL